MAIRTVSRREFVRDAGGLLVGFSLFDAAVTPALLAAPAQDALLASTPSPGRLDAWLRINTDGSVRVFTGKAEIGMGVDTALAQIVAEELDLSPARVDLVMGDTQATADQGGVGGSTSISLGARPLRNAAATARALLLQRASQRLGTPPVPVDRLEVRDGVVSVRGDRSRSVSYGELTESGRLDETLRVSGQGFGLNVDGAATPKDPADYTVVGTSVPRRDMPAKVLGRFEYVTDVRVPGMLHGRVVRPPGAGATLANVDEGPVRGIAGYVSTVVVGNFVGVVAETEWAAIQAARRLDVRWNDDAAAFPEQRELYAYMRAATPKATRETVVRGDAAAALATAATRIEARYDTPFQSHATMGPGCALADVREDGITTVWSGAQKPHSLRQGLAELLGIPPDRVRVVWMQDAGSYGRPGFADAAADAVLLSRAVGRPVRVQWMRADMTSWGTKGPAVVFDLAAGLDGQGEVVGLEYASRAFSGGEIMYLPSTAGNYLAGQLTGIPNTSGVDEFAEWGGAAPGYDFAHVRAVAHVLNGFHPVASPLRATHLRDPEGPATSFAVESFIDEIAAAAGADPLEFRLKHISEPRAREALRAAADAAGWVRRASPRRDAGASDVVTGRGLALGVRNGTYVGHVADVEVNRRTGLVRVTRLVCSHDCGLIINPEGLKRTIEANLIQSMGRALKEEVRFDRRTVTSVDWTTYPVARSSDVPPRVDVVLLNRPELPPGGAGEPSSRATAAAVANAIFDATGARVRRMPLTPDTVLSALADLRNT